MIFLRRTLEKVCSNCSHHVWCSSIMFLEKITEIHLATEERDQIAVISQVL